MNITFTPVLKTDTAKIQELSALASAIVREHYDPILGEEQNTYMIDMFQSVSAMTEQLEHGYSYYLVKADGVSVGFMGFYPRNGKMYLSKLYLQKDARGKGISHDMLAFLIDLTRRADLPSIELNVNKYNDGSIAAYEALGFVRTREEKNDIGHGYFMDDYVYELAVQ